MGGRVGELVSEWADVRKEEGRMVVEGYGQGEKDPGGREREGENGRGRRTRSMEVWGEGGGGETETRVLKQSRLRGARGGLRQCLAAPPLGALFGGRGGGKGERKCGVGASASRSSRESVCPSELRAFADDICASVHVKCDFGRSPITVTTVQ